jgi:uncharacterized protein YggE
MQTNHCNSLRPDGQRTRFLGLLAMTTLVCFAASCSRAGSPPAAGTKVTVVGDASLKAQPDAAVIVLSVVTQNSQALTAQQENARKSDAVAHAVKDSAGDNTEIKTNTYSLQPQQNYGDNKLPRITGYEARNSVTVTTTDLSKVGVIIDAASRAGANSVDGVSFILRDSSVTNGQVLAEATRQAMTKARSIAQAMGGRVVRVVEEQESGSQPMTAYDNSNLNYDQVSRGIATPVHAGPISINSRVQLIVEVDARPLAQ